MSHRGEKSSKSYQETPRSPHSSNSKESSPPQEWRGKKKQQLGCKGPESP